MTHKTRGIVLRSIKYGESSLVVTIFTRLFGIQTYMVNGVRTSKQSSAKANHFQPAAILDLLVYHHASGAMQRIKEFSWALIYRELLNNVIRNSIASFMMELLMKCLKQPEPNNDLFDFVEDALIKLDQAGNTVTANFALFFALHLPHFLGFRISDNYNNTNNILDLEEGSFVSEQPVHPHFISGEEAKLTAQLLKVMQPSELANFKLNQEIRRSLLLKYQEYYTLHLPEFGQLKTLQVLHEVLSS